MSNATNSYITAESIRVRGMVQGVGFRPTVWRLARENQLTGLVLNDGEGVQMLAQGTAANLDAFVESLQTNCPPLGRIEAIEREKTDVDHGLVDFQIIASADTSAHTGVVPDASTCDACKKDIFDVNHRRYGYAFTNCTHCGPRLSIIRAIPYDRNNTSMRDFTQCPSCQQEYEDPADRRFHAQPNACPDCGPQLWLEDTNGNVIARNDAIRETARHINEGKIVAIKGIGGIHLACDATNDDAIEKLRQRKHRQRKPLAMMAKDIAMVSRYAQATMKEAKALNSSAAPVVILDTTPEFDPVAKGIAPGQSSLGFMLPYSPLHHLLMAELDCPIVLTSGNRSDEPQCIENGDARQRLSAISDALLLHNRDIVNRIDDSVVRLVGDELRVLRRARGIAPSPIHLPEDLKSSPDLLALGSELKNTFCLLRDGEAVLSQHMGDLEEARTYDDYLHNLTLYQALYQHKPKAIVVDKHPEYMSTKHGKSRVQDLGIPLIEVQHHHAHICACLAENQWSQGQGKVLGIALDGLGFGDDGTVWGGEFLLADYLDSERVGHLRPFAMLGNAQAMREPWRNTYAHLSACFNWRDLSTEFAHLAIIQYLKKQPIATFDAMIKRSQNAPQASSAGRLFDAVAAAVGVCTERCSYEGQAAIELEAMIDPDELHHGYSFALNTHVIDPTPMWQELLLDLSHHVAPSAMAARFHKGLADAVCANADKLCRKHNIQHVALSGGVFQNKTLLTLCQQILETAGHVVMSHKQVPANDGGLALGQAAIAAAVLKRSA